MRTRVPFVSVLALVLAAAGAATAQTPGASHAAEPYKKVKEIAVGGSGGWDYITVDPAAHRLYVAHATKVVVLDAVSGQAVGEIPDLAGVHGFAIAPELGRGFSTNGRDNSSTIVDLKTLAPVGKVETGANPDAVAYLPEHKHVYTFNGRGQSATVFDAQNGTVLATIELGGKPEAPAYDASTHRLFVNLEDKAAIAVVDTATRTKIATWPLAGCEEPTGLAYAAAQHRLFSVCQNNVMTVVDSTTGQMVTTVLIGARSDGAAFDPATGYVFSSNGEGTLTVAHLDAPDKVTVVQTVTTQRSARTIALDPATHTVYLPAATMVAGPDGKQQAAPDSLKVLVFGMQ